MTTKLGKKNSNFNKYLLETVDDVNIIQSQYVCHLNGSKNFTLKYIENNILSCFPVSQPYVETFKFTFFVAPYAVIITLK